MEYDTFEALAPANCRRPVEVEAADSCWRDGKENVTVLVKLTEMVLTIRWESPAWREKSEEQKVRLVNRLAQAAAEGT